MSRWDALRCDSDSVCAATREIILNNGNNASPSSRGVALVSRRWSRGSVTYGLYAYSMWSQPPATSIKASVGTRGRFSLARLTRSDQGAMTVNVGKYARYCAPSRVSSVAPRTAACAPM